MNNKQTETLSIGGMSCAACAARVEKVVRNLDGVAAATVNLATEKLFVEFDGTRTLAAIKKTIVKAGYEVLEEKKKAPLMKPGSASKKK